MWNTFKNAIYKYNAIPDFFWLIWHVAIKYSSLC